MKRLDLTLAFLTDYRRVVALSLSAGKWAPLKLAIPRKEKR